MVARGGMRAAKIVAIVVIVCGLVVAGAALATEMLFRQPLVEGCHATVAGTSTELTVEEAENAALISAVSVQRGLPPRAATIALATAFQESGLRNIDYGHLDSVGLFQQRPSQGWGTVAEIQDPYYSAGRFYSALVDVRGYAAMEIAVAAQAVQRSADGSAYAQHEAGSRALASALTGQSDAAFSCEVQQTTASASAGSDLIGELGKAYGTAKPVGGDVGVTGSAATGLAVRREGDSIIDIPLASTQRQLGWSVAQWSVAYAKRFGVSSVSYDGHTWSADQSKDGWRADTETGPHQVRIMLASPS
ncbi:hypothetical protein [Actinopolymorpha pittospori]|uniref:ARB-07466-like C-terminal domain-containing protein n=1 Tax=Actinopolymorpha pittospori TaxID=648752 RepID=A0A927RP59_9ACTN|nr:hypothetical protein [Actinopolymorpha pittospori]MBE1611806.1 hypothetical protein [Actinopolymorpha pittospori]